MAPVGTRPPRGTAQASIVGTPGAWPLGSFVPARSGSRGPRGDDLCPIGQDEGPAHVDECGSEGVGFGLERRGRADWTPSRRGSGRERAGSASRPRNAVPIRRRCWGVAFAKCPAGQTRDTQGKCRGRPEGQREGETGKCEPIPQCGPDQEEVQGRCFAKCPAGQTRDTQGRCRASTGRRRQGEVQNPSWVSRKRGGPPSALEAERADQHQSVRGSARRRGAGRAATGGGHPSACAMYLTAP